MSMIPVTSVAAPHAASHYAGGSDQVNGQSLFGLRTTDSPTFNAITATGRVRSDDLRIGDGSTYDGYLTYGGGYFQLSAVTNQGLQFKANNSVALTIAATGAATFGGNVYCAALTATAAAGNNARIAVDNTGPIGGGGYNGFEFYETGVLKAVQYWDPSAARVTINAPFTLSSTATSTSNTTGALVVGGGIGVGGAINAGGQLAAAVGAARIGVRSTSTLTTAYNPTAFNDGNIVIDSGNGTGSYCGIRFTCGGSHEALFSSVQTAAGLSDFVWSGYNGGSYVERARLKSDGTFVVVNKITTVSAVPASFADLAAVRTWLAAQFT